MEAIMELCKCLLRQEVIIAADVDPNGHRFKVEVEMYKYVPDFINKEREDKIRTAFKKLSASIKKPIIVTFK